MNKGLSDQDLKRLGDLAALRDRGVLSEDEFQRAKQRLLQGNAVAPPAESEAEEKEPRSPLLWWGLGAAAIVAILLLWLFLGMNRNEGAQDGNIVTADESIVNGTTPQPTGAELCRSDTVYRHLKDFVFDLAVQQFDGNPAPLNSLRNAVGVRMQYPLLRGGDPGLERTDCSGRLIIDLPPAARNKFEGASALEADLEYSIQPAADGGGYVVQATGTDYVVQRLVAAATLLTEAQVAAQAAADKTYDPSFSCTGDLSKVERTICEDEDLSRLDRELAARYRDLKRSLPSEQWSEVAEGQKAFLAKRDRCADAACVRDAYGDQLAELPAQQAERPSEPVIL